MHNVLVLLYHIRSTCMHGEVQVPSLLLLLSLPFDRKMSPLGVHLSRFKVKGVYMHVNVRYVAKKS